MAWAQIDNGRLVGIRSSLWVLAKNLGLFPRLFPRFAGAGSGLSSLGCAGGIACRHGLGLGFPPGIAGAGFLGKGCLLGCLFSSRLE